MYRVNPHCLLCRVRPSSATPSSTRVAPPPAPVRFTAASAGQRSFPEDRVAVGTASLQVGQVPSPC